MNLRRPLALLSSIVCSVAVAQTHFCVAGDLDHLSSTELAGCRAKMSTIRNAVKTHGAPSGWHFVIVCDESGWGEYSRVIAGRGEGLREAAFHTDNDLQWTFIRGSRMKDTPEEAQMLLKAALDRSGRPHTSPIPNPKRVLRSPGLEVAKVEAPQPR